jgi:hypothetical protein
MRNSFPLAGDLRRSLFLGISDSFTNILLAILAALIPSGAVAQTPVLTQHNNNARNGAYAMETVLTPANVNQTAFGKIFSYLMDGRV